VLRSGVGHEAAAHIGQHWGPHGRALDASGERVDVRRSNQRGHDVGLRQNLKRKKRGLDL